ncbi:MAG: VWA domain-containing protein [Kofleriaceae bacterium]|nr:VWA domain-containing protein [Kofleriaceae bacterium]
MKAVLDTLGQRIERLAIAPETISAPLTRFFRPALYRFRWAPKTETDAIEQLLKNCGLALGEQEEADKLLRQAVWELRDNIAQIERATIVSQRPLLAHGAWLRRIYELLVRIDSESHLRFRVDPISVSPPLAYDSATLLDSAKGNTAQDDDSPAAGSSRLLELRLDTIDHLMAAAREEATFLGRRRRLLETARRMLLESSAALPLTESAVQQRLESIARHITDTNRAEAAGVARDVALIHQARSAVSRNETDKLRHILRLMRQASGESRQWAMSASRDTALQILDRMAPDTEDALAIGLAQTFGDDVSEAVSKGYADARTNGAEASGDDHFDNVMAEVVEEYLVPGKERDTLANALAVDGCFEVGGVLTPVRVTERHVRQIEVFHPTQEMHLQAATSPKDIPYSIVGDPRMLILDLAAGRLLTRRYRKTEHEVRSRELMQGEVRVYVLDGSSSMLGPRARMRDAIMVAELATLMKRLSDPDRHTRIVLYFRYFNRKLGELHKVDSRGGALEAIRIVTGTPRIGGTDIEAALLSSLDQVRQAKEEDPELARAQIVMVTDGEAPISNRIEEAQAKLGDLPVGISIIALGEQNRVLRALVAKQRQRGEGAFYHFLPDNYLLSLSADAQESQGALPFPVVLPTDQPLNEQFAAAMQELDDIERAQTSMAMRSLDSYDREELLETPPTSLEGEGQRARLELAQRDHEALLRRFQRWFPPTPDTDRSDTGLAVPGEETLEADDVESIIVVLASIADVVEAISSDAYSRRADALDLLERILPNARLSPARYRTILKLYPTTLAPALRALHGAIEHGLGHELGQI